MTASPHVGHVVSFAWAGRARCRGADPKQFHAPFGEDPVDRRAREDAAKSRYCDHCEVVQECRAWAREHHEYGVWGGETEDERAAEGFVPTLSRRKTAGTH
jgi:WhiB family transcriptional regulator, redox-sensing transcriptional regulator